MKPLEGRVLKEGIVREGNVLKVDSVLKHQMDVEPFSELGRVWARLVAAGRFGGYICRQKGSRRTFARREEDTMKKKRSLLARLCYPKIVTEQDMKLLKECYSAPVCPSPSALRAKWNRGSDCPGSKGWRIE